jgi:hypothetical protein
MLRIEELGTEPEGRILSVKPYSDREPNLTST